MTFPARITTFYSYKGGTGRSMAVANLAVWMARSKPRVLAMDFDLDAPGLHRYFPKQPSEPARAGVIDFFVRLRASVEAAFPAASFNPEDSGAIEQCRDIVKSLLADDGFFQPTSEPTLRLMPAGRFDAAYADNVRGFPWADFFSQFGEVFAILREELKTRYDEVLIDSRTGLTDLGSVSTVIMPDRLVVVFTPNEQSSAGAAEIAQQSFHLHSTLPGKKHGTGPLEIIPLMSRVDRGELVERKEWMAHATARFSEMFQTLNLKGPDFLEYFNERHIPYSGYYSYGERIAVAEDKDVGFGSLVEAYQNFAAILDSPAGFQHWRFGGERISASLSQTHPRRIKLEQVIEKVQARLKASNMPYGAEVALSNGVWERSSQGLTKWQGTGAYLVSTLDDDDAFGLAVRGVFSRNGRVIRVPNGYIEDAWVAMLPTGAPGIGLQLTKRLVTQGPNNDELVFEDNL